MPDVQTCIWQGHLFPVSEPHTRPVAILLDKEHAQPPSRPAAQPPSRRAFLKVGTAATAALVAVPAAILPGEADAAPSSGNRIASLWARWQALRPEYEHLVAEDRAASDRYFAAQPALPREAYAGQQHFGFGVKF
ncbi:twin-arginine translocation signal domain-containing protein [Xanthobacter flavus]|uniref:twin-arginine translocation signal domain-containing protein n=1 Tax=Xanthobacter flavus TaxID=281 RepID=UPI0037297700